MRFAPRHTGHADDLCRWRMTIGNDHLPTTRKFTYNLLLHMQQKGVRAILCNVRGHFSRVDAPRRRARTAFLPRLLSHARSSALDLDGPAPRERSAQRHEISAHHL